MAIVRVKLPTSPAPDYDVLIEPGALRRLGELVRGVAPAPSCGLITDSQVAPHYLAAAKASLAAAGYRVIEHVFPAGETHKNVATLAGAWDALLAAKIERATPIVALGGGVVGDLAGFVAASVLRGVPFVQVPTTLLAAVDASVGGKVGIDHAAGKNLLGAFHQPRLVVSDVETFRTLPEREVRCGVAECIKHGIIRDAKLFAFIATHAAKIMAQDAPTMNQLVAWNVSIKAAIVGEDPFETGVRALLNLGHTFGHAIENVMEYGGVQHGEAVAVGMIAAARLAVQSGWLTPRELQEIVDVIDLVGLPTGLPDLDVERTLAAMATDKKVRAGRLRFVLPTRIGAAEVFDAAGIDPAQVRAAVESLRHRATGPQGPV